MKTDAERHNDAIHAKLDKLLLLMTEQHYAYAYELVHVRVVNENADSALSFARLLALCVINGFTFKPLFTSLCSATQHQQEKALLMAVEVERWDRSAAYANQPWRYGTKKRAIFFSYQFSTNPYVQELWKGYTGGQNER
ncbi:hypothetical protein V8E36_009365 [Tilletia maclaganii]